MYNRYIHQNDGSYRRHPVQEERSQQALPKEIPPLAEKPHQEPPRPKPEPPVSFLRNLLPREFDTGDLLIVLLLLLMAGDRKEDNTALLTLALYFFM